VTLDATLAARLADPGLAGTPVGGYVAPVVEVTDATADGVAVRRYSPVAPAVASPVTLVWVHGGGFGAGDLDMPESDVVAREIVARAGVRVVAVGYRLAVDGVRFPAPLDDVVAATRAVLAPAGDAPVVLGGTSAGGNLALATALRLRDEAGAGSLAGLVLAYPYLHVVNPPLSADLAERMAPLPEHERFTTESVRAMVENYLGPLADSPPRYAYPGDDPDLGRLPRTLVIGAEYDDLLSSALAGAASLRAAGVDVEEHFEPGVLHGHLNTPGLPGALRTLDRIVAWLPVAPARPAA
jgi:acetyl esterase